MSIVCALALLTLPATVIAGPLAARSTYDQVDPTIGTGGEGIPARSALSLWNRAR